MKDDDDDDDDDGETSGETSQMTLSSLVCCATISGRKYNGERSLGFC